MENGKENDANFILGFSGPKSSIFASLEVFGRPDMIKTITENCNMGFSGIRRMAQQVLFLYNFGGFLGIAK